MWKDFVAGYIKNNRTSCVSVMVAAFVSALLLSFLCGIFYNLWVYEIDRITEEEGDWQGRLMGEIGEEELALIQNYANVERILVNREQLRGPEITVDLYFKNVRTILRDMPRIAELAGLEAGAASYHHALLNLYLVRDPADTAPRLLFPFFLAVTAIACVSLIMIIHNSFAVSMNDRIHQFGILSGIGATPGQIRVCLLQEAGALCALPVLAGSGLGILLGKGVLEGTNLMLADVAARKEAVWEYHPMILLFSLAITAVTVWISAWIPAGRMSRLTPLEAVKNTGELTLKRKRNSRLMGLLFGIEGELAGNALKAQRKALRTATLSLTLSFLAFSLMTCFFTLTKISQRMTYFARYQDAWDVMVTLKHTEGEELEEIEKLRELPGVRSCVAYQIAGAKRAVGEEELSEDMRSMGGFQNAPEAYVTDYQGLSLVNAPVLVLDDPGFLEYCEQIGAPLKTDGAVIVNRVRDLAEANFRDVKYFPYLNGRGETTLLRQAGREEISAEVPVLFYTEELPLLREAFGELDYYELVHVLPGSLWRKIKEQIGGASEESHIRILAGEEVSPEELEELEEAVKEVLARDYEAVVENRIRDKENNDAMMDGMMLILGGFCVLLAIIGMGNVFSNTLGFVRQRKREIARYVSVGMTPEGVRKLFCLEALALAGRPALLALAVTVIATGLMIRASYLDPMVFLGEAPILPILIFLLAVFAFVGLAYFLGGRRACKVSVADALGDDTML